jgi:PleD family two-component response regulator
MSFSFCLIVHCFVKYSPVKASFVRRRQKTMNMLKSKTARHDQDFLSTMADSRHAVVVVVSDDPSVVEALEPVCAFLELRTACVSSGMDLLAMLQTQQPIAVISDIDGEEQDGFHTMKVVADYQRDLPIFMLTEGDPVLMGASDAVQEVCGLTAVAHSSGVPMAGEMISFLFSAGRRAGCMRLVPI